MCNTLFGVEKLFRYLVMKINYKNYIYETLGAE
jgi:hypothetical protein